ncbi:MAG: rRNA maturation RNase YbeY [Xanthomonadales bacterium]|nr:Endoribonuclease YbeY [Xanthomonadales bacterium]MCC6593150.1 rRNA maturation RNase YbeY [Xanthomonadales bacterium]MCE7931306.1 rRNA maturation RNase YbeY [Xanthomonadales bacterium PRO6]
MTLQLELALGYAAPRRGVPARASFQRWAEAALRGARRRGRFALSLRVVDADEGHRLNRDYRGRDYPTNVLSFPADARMDGARLLGDLALCAPVVAREAVEQGKSATAHWAHLTVHGVLHLLGHDHEDAARASTMEALEVRILAGLGLCNPYEDNAK